jgi:hypothetical protein
MTEHLVEAHFKVRADAITSNELPRGFTQHFKNFAVTPEGHIIIKNFSVEFRDKLQEVLMDEGVPFKAILPVMRF